MYMKGHIMLCQNCGQPLPVGATVCPSCGAPVQPVAPDDSQAYAQQPGYPPQQPYSQQYAQPYAPPPGYTAQVAYAYPVPAGYEQKSKLAAGLLGIFLGGFGVGRFYLGYPNLGVAQLLVSIFTLGLGGLWGFIDGIMILTGSVKVDGQGIPLRD